VPVADQGKTAPRGGQGNEAGSVYRRGVGAILATHGLRDKGIAALEMPDSGPYPEAIAFETLDAVDDIRCELSDGTCLYLQSKRTYGKDKTFKSAVEQWMAMLERLRDGDRLVIVSADAKGEVAALPSALWKRRAGGVLTAPEKDAISALADAAGLSATSSRFDELCAVGHAWHASANSRFDPGYQLCAEMLDGVVVKASHGGGALDVLVAGLHSDAGTATRSTLRDWWKRLDDARIPLIGSASGSAARRLTAERDAERCYREVLTRGMNVVDFSLLSDALAPLTVPDLLSTVVVSSALDAAWGHALPDVVRGHQDVVLVGHPGAGKTTAVRQLAADFATRGDAPLPIVVKLSRIRAAVRDPNDVTLELLVTDAVAHVPEQHRTVMADIARRELMSGFALLVCDGLDECRTRASAVVDGLVQLKQQFSPDVGVLLTTRASALRSARKAGCQVMHLLAPTRVHKVQSQALHAAMTQLALSPDERARREQRLKRVQAEQPAITSVPLLGNLVAVLVGLGGDSNLDGSVADLLEQVIKEALSRWEANRGLDSMKVEPHLLWDGYVVIGHLVAETGTATRSEATSRVAAKLRESWGKAEREAEALADEVVDFWDTTIAVFIEDGDGILTPRSRVFADLADAVWMIGASGSEQISWIEHVLSDETRSDSLVLAVSKDPTIADLALASISDIDARRVLVEWLCDAADRIPFDEACIEALLNTLIERADDAADWLPRGPVPAESELFWSQDAQDKKDGRAWPFVRRAAMLPLPPGLREGRDQLIARVSADPERSTTAAVLAAATDATHDGRPLNAEERVHVAALLALPLPSDTDRLIETKRNTFSIRPTEPMLSGRPDAVLRAIRILEELPQDVVDAMAEFTSWIPERYVSEIEAEIVRRDMSYTVTEDRAESWRWPAIFNEPSALPIALIDVGLPTQISAGAAWWCREFFTLYRLMAVGKAPAIELRHLNADPGRSTLVRLVQIYCAVNDLNPDTLAAQVARAADGGEEALRHLQTLAYQNNSTAPQTKSLAVINAEQRTTLRAALTSPSGWLGLLAFMVSRCATDDELSAMLIADVATMHPHSQRWAVFSACHLATDPIDVAKRLADADVGTRAAAAGYLDKFGGTSEAAAALVRRFLNDDDLRVQLAAGYQGPFDAVAKVWTCWSCLQQNDIAAEDCAHCEHGSRP
jgi:NACHT domain